MIIKQRDSLRMRKLELEILRKFSLPPDKAFLVEQEWKSLHSGEKGEKDAAYYLDFYLGDNKNHALIHDLRLEHNGQVAQIDHLLINRLMEIFVLETKAFGQKLEIQEDGYFVARYGHKSFGIPSPLDQNQRHIHVLQKLIREKSIAPTRLGIPIPITYENYVLLHPSTELVRPTHLNTERVRKADDFLPYIQRQTDKTWITGAVKMGKVISRDTLQTFARKLTSLHCKSDVNYRERFGITDDDLKTRKVGGSVAEPQPRTYQAKKRAPSSQNFCARCRANISQTVAKFCFNNKPRFGGRAYCIDCQKTFQA